MSKDETFLDKKRRWLEAINVIAESKSPEMIFDTENKTWVRTRHINVRHYHQAFLTCRRELDLLKKEMADCEYTGKIVFIGPCTYRDEPRIHVIVEKGSSVYRYGSWNAMIGRVRLQTTNRKYSTDDVVTAMIDAGLSDDECHSVLKRLYPEYLKDRETESDWKDEEWFKKNKED